MPPVRIGSVFLSHAILHKMTWSLCIQSSRWAQKPCQLFIHLTSLLLCNIFSAYRWHPWTCRHKPLCLHDHWFSPAPSSSLGCNPRDRQLWRQDKSKALSWPLVSPTFSSKPREHVQTVLCVCAKSCLCLNFCCVKTVTFTNTMGAIRWRAAVLFLIKTSCKTQNYIRSLLRTLN